jgi:hypothetical protein
VAIDGDHATFFVKFIGHANGAAPPETAAAVWVQRTFGSVDIPIVEQPDAFSMTHFSLRAPP